MSTLPKPSIFYATPGPMTDPGEFAPLLIDLPTNLPDLVRTLNGLVVHIFWDRRYGLAGTNMPARPSGMAVARRLSSYQ